MISLALLIVFVGHRYWNTDLPFADDIQQVIVQGAKFNSRALQHGVLPWWDHWNGEMFGQTYARTVPISSWYTAALSLPWGEAVGVKLAIVGLLIIAAWGMRRFLLRHIGIPWVAWMGGVTFALNRFSLFEHVAAGHFEMTMCYAWFPWWLILLDRALVERDHLAQHVWSAAAGMGGGLLLMFDVQFGGMHGMIGAFYLVARWTSAGSPEGRRRIWRTTGWLVAWTAIGSAYFLANLLTMKPHVAFTRYGTDWLSSLSTTWQGMFLHWAPIWDGSSPAKWTARFSQFPHVNLLSGWPWVCVGLVVWKIRDTRTLLWLALYLFSMGMAMALNGPLGFVYEYVPVFKMFRAAIRFYNVASVAMCFFVPLGIWMVTEHVGTSLEPGVRRVMGTGVFLVLIMGVLDGPKAWESFKTGLMYPGRESMYQWMKTHPLPVAVTQYPFNFLENRSVRWGSYQHEHRDPMGVGFTVNTADNVAALRAANFDLSPEALSKFLAVGNFGYIIPRGEEDARTLHRAPGLTLAFQDAEGMAYRHQGVLPLVRVVTGVVGVTGSDAAVACQAILERPDFDPGRWASVALPTDREAARFREEMGDAPDVVGKFPHRWTRVHEAGPSTRFQMAPEGARMVISGPAGSWNGWKRGGLLIDTTATPRFSLRCRGASNSRVQFQFFLEEGQEFRTEWTPPPATWQSLSLGFRPGTAIIGIALLVQTTDGAEAWLEVQEMSASASDGRPTLVIDTFREVGRLVESGPWTASVPSARLTADRSHPEWGHYQCDVEVPKGHGLLVVAERWYPQWRAWVDGRERPVYKAYGSYLGVPLREGRHTVEVRYSKTPLQRAGWWILLAGWGLASAGTGWVVWRRRRLPGATAP